MHMDFGLVLGADFHLGPGIEYLALFMWAISGAVTGIRRGFDVIGAFVIALASATGGSLLRDGLLLHHTPPLLSNQYYLPLILVATVMVIMVSRARPQVLRPPIFDKLINIIDAAGTPAFAVLGMQVALADQVPWPGVVLVGVVNGVGGGLLRDLLVRDVPVLFQPGQWSAAVVFLCCLLFIVLVKPTGLPGAIAAIIIIPLGFFVRVLIIRYNWRSRPVMPAEPTSSS